MGYISTIVEWTDVRRPTRRDLLVTVVGFGAFLAAVAVISTVAVHFQTDIATHQTTDRAEHFDTSATIWAFVAIWIIVALEEYTFRNLLQKLLYGWMDYTWAIGVTSVIFTSLHIPAYGGLSTPASSLAFPLTVVFVGSVILGYAYWRTGNVVVATLIHGCINTLALVVAVT